MDCPPIPQFCLNFLLRTKTYLKECPPSTSVTNRQFPLSSKPEDVVRLVYTHYKVQIPQSLTTFTAFEHLLVHNIATSNVSPPPL